MNSLELLDVTREMGWTELQSYITLSENVSYKYRDDCF